MIRSVGMVVEKKDASRKSNHGDHELTKYSKSTHGF